jgi:hypothetical protein
MTRVYETEADDFFRADAERLGYLAEDGPGLRAYYKDHGMVQPEVLEREIPKRELTGLQMELPFRDAEGRSE